MEQKKDDLKKIGALWERQTKTGDTYFSGKLDSGESLLIFKARVKKHEKSPDWNIMMKQDLSAVIPPAIEGGDFSQPTFNTNEDDLPF